MTSEDVQISQRNAQRLLNEPEFRAALDQVRTAYLDAWKRTRPDEKDKREELWHLHAAMTDIESMLAKKAQAAKVRDLKQELEREHGDNADSPA